jgi:hypothetical protein
LNQQKSDRPSPKNRYTVAGSNLSQMGRVQRHTERFEQGSRFVVDRIRHRKTTPGRYVHELAQAAGIGKQSTKVHTATEIGMPMFAKIAPVTRLRRVNRHTHACPQRLPVAIQGVGSEGFNHAREFVTEDQGRFENGVANPSILIGMQVAAADAGRSHPQQHLPRPRRPRMGDLFHTDVARTVKTSGEDLIHMW